MYIHIYKYIQRGDTWVYMYIHIYRASYIPLKCHGQGSGDAVTNCGNLYTHTYTNTHVRHLNKTLPCYIIIIYILFTRAIL